MAIEDFVLNTDYPVDKVIYLLSGSFSLPGSTYPVINVPHNLPFPPLLGGSWSLTPDFLVCYELDSGPISFADTTFVNTQYMGAAADSTNVRINAGNNVATGVTIYYRIYGLQPTGYPTADIPVLSASGDDFLLNTDYNLTKLFTADVVSQPATTTPAATITVNHNIGYIPQVVVWEEVSGYIRPMTLADTFVIAASTTVTSTTVSFFTPEFSSAKKYHYRIYLDA